MILRLQNLNPKMYTQPGIIYRNPNTDLPSENSLQSIVFSVLSLAEFALYLYVLISSHTPAVLEACGSDLWNTMLANILVGFLLVGVICCAALCGPAGVVFAFVVFLVVMVTMVSLLLHFGVQALNAPACNAAMSAATTFRAPMLAVMAFVSAAMSGAYLLVFACALLFLGSAAMVGTLSV